MRCFKKLVPLKPALGEWGVCSLVNDSAVIRRVSVKQRVRFSLLYLRFVSKSNVCLVLVSIVQKTKAQACHAASSNSSAG